MKQKILLLIAYTSKIFMKMKWEAILTLALGAATFYLAIRQVEILDRQTSLMSDQTAAMKYEQKEKVREQLKDIGKLIDKFERLGNVFLTSFNEDNSCQKECRFDSIWKTIEYFKNEKYRIPNWKNPAEDYKEISYPSRSAVWLYEIYAGFRRDLPKVTENEDDIKSSIKELMSDGVRRCDLEASKVREVVYQLDELSPWISEIPRRIPDDLEVLMRETLIRYAVQIGMNGDRIFKLNMSSMSIGSLHESISKRTNEVAKLMRNLSLSCQEKAAKDEKLLKSLDD